MTFNEFLQNYFFTPDGLNLIVGLLLSIIVEKFHKWDKLAAIDKRLIIYALTLAIAIIGAVARCLHTGDCGFDSTFWPAIRAAGEVFTMAHVPHTVSMWLEHRRAKTGNVQTQNAQTQTED